MARSVYSSEHGRLCPDCEQPVASCRCKTATGASAGDGRVRIRLEAKGRRGKTVTTISGLALDPASLRDLAAELKRRCGSGGAVKAGIVEIQGDHRDAVEQALETRGIRSKRAG